jgi:sporulation protein YqfC
MKTKRDRAELLADKLDIPADALGSVKLSLCGRSRLLIENHRGIITYNDNLIEIDCGSVKLTVRGDALRLGAMNGSDMFICGRIIALEFE